MSALFPLFTNLKGRTVLVVGGGEIALRKIHLLFKSDARISVVARQAEPQLYEWHEQGLVNLQVRDYQSSDLDQVWLVVAATENTETNGRIAAEAETRHLFANVVDDAELSSFQVPAIVDRAPLMIAISSSGVAPMVARQVRARLESLLDHSLGRLVSLLQPYRQRIREARPQLKGRRAFYDWLLSGPVASAVSAQQPQQAEQLLEQALSAPALPLKGEVILVGAGSGDPGLLSLHALRALNQADVILYDRLVDPAILELARRDATQVYVGKQVGEDHHATQARIHTLLRDYAQQGQTVVRLKGGDAFIFGRGGEELEFLRDHGINFKVVPGITAALACAAYSGIPLTHRDYAQSLQLVTAHHKVGGQTENWGGLCDSKQTVVVYMGLQQMMHFSQRLILQGRDASTPCALIENGSRPNQRVLLSTVGKIAQHAQQYAFQSPSLLVIGEVAIFAAKLHWYGELIDEYHGAKGRWLTAEVVEADLLEAVA